uniref:Uncharacterized protein n=1 Tax=Petromyzon marinus TaxID=7757 RepID=S4RER2_PETMA
GSAGTSVLFNENGDAPGRYDIFQYQLTNTSSPGYKVIGQWIDLLKLDRTNNHEIAGEVPREPQTICWIAPDPGRVTMEPADTPSIWLC